MLPRVAFDFIVKRDIEIFVWTVTETFLYILLVGTDVLGGPRSQRSQIAHPFIIKARITYRRNIFIFCFRTAEDVGPYRFDMIL